MTRGPIRSVTRGSLVPLVSLIAAAVVVVAGFAGARREGPVPSFAEQLCSLPRPWLIRIQRGYAAPRSGHISILPRTPAYTGTAEGGWSHSGPWGYLQRVPLVFYGPGVIRRAQTVERPVTLADVAPTLMTLLKGSYRDKDGASLDEVVQIDGRLVAADRPRLILVVVWDGGGWNVLQRWPDAWPHLKRLMASGVSFTNATVGSSPSVTPSVHTTLGTGAFPWRHEITGIPVRDETGRVVDSFEHGESGRFMALPALAERWDEHNGNRALVGMVGYEPWHLGMIGKGAESTTGDKDDAVWLDRETNEWITNPAHYRLPDSVLATGGLDRDIARLDSRDGAHDGAWGDLDILDAVDRREETPAFISYHGRVLRDLIAESGYGADRVTDMLFTNFKQIDRLGHYFNMDSEQVRQAIEETDAQLGATIAFLNRVVGKGNWISVVTADHGQQPDAEVVDGYGLDPKEVARDIDDRFGPVTRSVHPTEVFLRPDADVDPDSVARWLYDYRLADNTQRPDMLIGGAGRFDGSDRIYQMAVPSELLASASCGTPGPGILPR